MLIPLRLAGAMEDRLEEANVAGPLASPHNWEDMENLAVWCRAAAALQPDGTDIPCKRCEVYSTTHQLTAATSRPRTHALSSGVH